MDIYITSLLHLSHAYTHTRTHAHTHIMAVGSGGMAESMCPHLWLFFKLFSIVLNILPIRCCPRTNLHCQIVHMRAGARECVCVIVCVHAYEGWSKRSEPQLLREMTLKQKKILFNIVTINSYTLITTFTKLFYATQIKCSVSPL